MKPGEREEMEGKKSRKGRRERKLHKQPEGRQMNYITKKTELIGSSVKRGDYELSLIEVQYACTWKATI